MLFVLWLMLCCVMLVLLVVVLTMVLVVVVVTRPRTSVSEDGESMQDHINVRGP